MDCSQYAVGRVWMKGKRASPKERLVCLPCSDWLVDEQLADVYVDNAGLGPEICQRRPGQACYYEPNEVMTGCLKNKEAVVWMHGRRATPKKRSVCSSCARWLVGAKLAVLMEASETSPAPPTPSTSVPPPGNVDTTGENLRHCAAV